MKYIKYFNEISIKDLNLVGGKTASIGQMINNLQDKNISIPQGFAVTTNGYWHFLEHNKLKEKIEKSLEKLKKEFDLKILQEIGQEIRELINKSNFPQDLAQEISQAYTWLSDYYKQENIDVAVRSSATAEDLPGASFAGQQETYLNIKTLDSVLEATKKCFASLFTDRAISYRIEKGFADQKIALSVAIQKMVRSDEACSGVIFTIDTETGFKNSIIINSSYGLGENIVKGIVNPDEFHVFKPTLKLGFNSIIKKYLGSKEKKLIYTNDINNPTKNIDVEKKLQNKFSLTDKEIIELAKQAYIIEEYYSKLNNKWTPMDIEWAKDGKENKLYIVQARPETVHSIKNNNYFEVYKLKESQNDIKVILTGLSVGKKIASGKAKILKNIDEQADFQEGDILVTSMTDPDWVPLMKKASGIITDKGGRTCHAAIVSRELGIPAIIGTEIATKIIKDKENITIDSSQGSTGYIYSGIQEYNKEIVEIDKLPKSPVTLQINIADPDRAYELSFLPVNGVGLARMEFIITNYIKVHPMAICQPDKILDEKTKDQIKKLSEGFDSPKEFYIEKLSQGIAQIAAAFYPNPVLLRLSDFKTNEYRDLIGGQYFEHQEENPMLGFRGAVRYCSQQYSPAFQLECEAIKITLEKMGLNNIKIMIPFVRTISEAECSLGALAKNNLIRGKNNLEIFMMCEIPSNIILFEDFAKYFDGFSIGSNDLTQLILGVDRDSAELSKIYNETDPAVIETIKLVIQKAKKAKKHISICGQAPSDYPEIADMLIKEKIDAISLNPDSVIPFLLRFKKTL